MGFGSFVAAAAAAAAVGTTNFGAAAGRGTAVDCIDASDGNAVVAPESSAAVAAAVPRASMFRWKGSINPHSSHL